MRYHITIPLADLGITEDGQHTMTLTVVEERCLDILQRQGQGRGSAIPAKVLARWIFQAHDLEQDMRNLRELINHLIFTHLLPICSMPGNGGGYWLPESPDEEAAVYEARRKRALTGLLKMARGRKAAYVETLEQLTLWFDDPVGADVIERLRLAPEEGSGMPAWMHLITKFLNKIDADPQRYAAEIRALQRTYGNIFVPRSTISQLRDKVREAEALLKEIA
jgi:hypothetical protein